MNWVRSKLHQGNFVKRLNMVLYCEEACGIYVMGCACRWKSIPMMTFISNWEGQRTTHGVFRPSNLISRTAAPTGGDGRFSSAMVVVQQWIQKLPSSQPTSNFSFVSIRISRAAEMTYWPLNVLLTLFLLRFWFWTDYRKEACVESHGDPAVPRYSC